MPAYLAGWFMGAFDVIGVEVLAAVLAALAWRRRKMARHAATGPDPRIANPNFPMPSVNLDKPTRRIPDA